MLKDRRIHGLILIIFLAGSVLAQTNTDSPYSRFGIGRMIQPGFDKSRAMGGIGLGMRDNIQLNYLNPASFSSIDTMSFLFDFGVMNNYTIYETSLMSSSYFASHLDHIALGFPLTKWWTASAGVLPYSKVGYAVKEEANDPNIGFIDYVHNGSGGLNQLYLGTALEFFNTITIAANFKYLFGSIDLVQSIDFPLEDLFSFPEITSQTIIKDFLIELGLQYHQNIGEKFELTLGVIFDNETSLIAKNTIVKRNIFQGSSVPLNDSTQLNPVFVLEESNSEGKIIIPQNIGAGFSLKYNNQFLLGVDYYEQDWTNATFFGQKEPLTKSNSIHAGLQIIPNPQALRGYHKWISYRAGAHYTNTYLQLHGEQLKDYGISFGVGLPLRGFKSSFNVALQLGRMGALDNDLILEDYRFLSFSLTLHDIWFFKRKFD